MGLGGSRQQEVGGDFFYLRMIGEMIQFDGPFVFQLRGNHQLDKCRKFPSDQLGLTAKSEQFFSGFSNWRLKDHPV